MKGEMLSGQGVQHLGGKGVWDTALPSRGFWRTMLTLSRSGVLHPKPPQWLHLNNWCDGTTLLGQIGWEYHPGRKFCLKHLIFQIKTTLKSKPEKPVTCHSEKHLEMCVAAQCGISSGDRTATTSLSGQHTDSPMVGILPGVDTQRQ